MSPVKEPRYFAVIDEDAHILEHGINNCPGFLKMKNNSISKIDNYIDLFRSVKNEKVIGEASPLYLTNVNVAKRLKQFNPKAKIFAILRNPFDAAYATYLMLRRLDNEKKDFSELILAENINDGNYWAYPRFVKSRFYDLQLKSYFDIFDSDQIMVSIYEDLQDTHELLASLFSFLKIDPDFSPDTTIKYNVEKNRKFLRSYSKILRNIPPVWRENIPKILPGPVREKYLAWRNGATKENVTSSKCPADIKNLLMPMFKPHILNLEDMIDRDLSHWLK
jgi:hypothetical protein